MVTLRGCDGCQGGQQTLGLGREMQHLHVFVFGGGRLEERAGGLQRLSKLLGGGFGGVFFGADAANKARWYLN